MNKKEQILKILDSLNTSNKILSEDDLGLNLADYGNILDIMINDKLIFDVGITKGGYPLKAISVNANNAKITIKGIEYLESNR